MSWFPKNKVQKVDIFERLKSDKGPLGQYAEYAHGYFSYPKLEGEISPYMKFRGREVLCWSINNYLGLANQPEVREVDAQSAEEWGLATPMGSRMMSGNSDYHEQLEAQLATFIGKEDVFLLNYGYQGIFSIIDALLTRHDVVVYDRECHACIIDGIRMHQGKRFAFPNNDVVALEKQLAKAQTAAQRSNGGVLVVTEGVFGMSGVQGKIKEIAALKEKYQFRLLVDDAHGFGTMGATGAGTGEEQQCQNEVDLYFSTFAKSMAAIGAFIGGDQQVINFLRYNMRSQIFAKSLPMPFVIGGLKRLELLKNRPELRDNLWKVVNALQQGLREKGFNIGNTEAPVTPVILSANESMAANLIIDLRENFGIFCSAVIYPVIPKGMIILRLIPTAMHTLEDVEVTIKAFEAVAKKIQEGAYSSEMKVTS